MRTIEGHHDFGVLERRLASLVREAQQGDPAGALAPVAVVAPTGLLLGHLRRVLAASTAGLVNVHFFHHASLARAATTAGGGGEPRALSPRVLTALVSALLDESGGDLGAYARARPGCASALLATLNDLREAGVDGRIDTGVDGLGRRGMDVGRLHALYLAALERLASTGRLDRAGYLRRAQSGAAASFGRFRVLIHFGAYEIIGANLDLLRTIEAGGTRVVYLVPHHPSSPAYEHARRFWPAALGVSPAELPDTGGSDRLLADRLPDLYDESAPPRHPQGDDVAFFQAQGPASELREVALRILSLHAAHDVPLHEMAIVARSLAPYAALLRPVFAEHRLPFLTTASLPALREPRALAALHLARAALGDCERQPLMDLFRSGLAIDPTGTIGREAHAWDRLGREWRVARGASTWTRDLPAWVEAWEPFVAPDADDATRERAAALKEARRRQGAGLAAAVERIVRETAAWRNAAGWSAWAEAARGCLASLIDGLSPRDDRDEDPGARAVLDVLEDMRDLDAAGVRFTPREALGWFERALEDAAVPIGSVSAGGAPLGADGGGVRILDAMQARGLAFDAVFLVGFNADLFPRRAREDPFLGDADRRLLRDRLARPVPVKADGRDEEHLLLAHLLGAARRRLTVSWLRADEAGQARIPSLALREVARAALGGADLARALQAARRVPAHPAEAGADTLERFGFLPPEAARRNVALQLGSPRRLLTALADLPASPSAPGMEALRAGLEMMRRTESEAADDLSYDAILGDAAPRPAVWSPSRLETMGACPQHYFFRHVLRVEESAGPPEEYELEGADLGLLAHRVLHDVYRDLADAGEFAARPGDPRRAARRAEEGARRAWERHAEPLAGRLRGRYPLLWETMSSRWIDALVAFAREDAAALVRGGARVIGLERDAAARLALGGAGGVVDLRGRIDRAVLDGAGVLTVADYKTAGDLDNLVGIADMLKGTRLQMPLYLLLAEALRAAWDAAEAPVRAEVLGVGPAFTPQGGRPGEGDRRAAIDPDSLDRNRAGLEETLGAIVEMAAAGSFPLNPDSRMCGWCPYVRACRRTHEPTLERLAASDAGALHALLRRKSTRAPTLAEVRARAGGRQS